MQVELQCLRGVRSLEQDRFLRQPFQHGPIRHRQVDVLPRPASRAAIPLAAARCGQQGLGPRIERHLNLQLITTGNATGRMQDHQMTDRFALGIQSALHPQGTAMLRRSQRTAPTRPRQT